MPYTSIWPSLSDAAKSAFHDSTHFFPELDLTNFFTFSRFRMCLSSPAQMTAHGLPPALSNALM